MPAKLKLVIFVAVLTVGIAFAARAQDLGPGFHKIKDGIYTFAPDQLTTTCSFVITEIGVVMIDACNSPLGFAPHGGRDQKGNRQTDHVLDRYRDARRPHW